MRTKALLCAAALAATAFTASAQVYSQNVVGYVNITCTNGQFTLLANQLDVDGTMTNNTLQSVFGTNFPTLTKFVTYTKASGYVNALYGSSGWTGSTNIANAMLAPGRGGFIYIPPSKPTTTVTMVGQVIQGTNAIGLDTGFSMVSSIAPVAGGIQTVLHLNGNSLDKIQKWNPVSGFSQNIWSGANSNWGSVEPTVNVGEAFLYYARTLSNTWTQTFTVQ